jgi:hypothetical protein
MIAAGDQLWLMEGDSSTLRPRKVNASLSTRTEERSRPIRRAVRFLLGDSESLKKLIPATGWKTPERIAWNILSVWSVAPRRGKEFISLSEAFRWFFSNGLDEECSKFLHSVDGILCQVSVDSEFFELLPYILEEHGPGSRYSVMKDPSTAPARRSKKENGVFYTPCDVADYMVRRSWSLFPQNPTTVKWLDPACGTGVFLLAAVRRARQALCGSDLFEFVRNCLFGCDISEHALDAAAFVLLRETGCGGLHPLEAWKTIRSNFRKIDALTIESAHKTRNDGELFAADERLGPLEKVFPSCAGGFQFIVGNPPYSELPKSARAALTSSFETVRCTAGKARANAYPVFIEQSLRLLNNDAGVVCLVTPLSLAYNTEMQYVICRRLIQQAKGTWDFAFFDREPHALFGEEVKTRNAILFFTREIPTAHSRVRINTGPLRKWTSRTRVKLFEKIQFTPLPLKFSIELGIPKLEGGGQVAVFEQLKSNPARFRNWGRHLTCSPQLAFSRKDRADVFIGGTAYNFLNVYRPLSDFPSGSITLTASKVHCVRFETEEEAAAAYAIMNSRLVFWMWSVLGDGFHVQSNFIKSFPIDLSCISAMELQQLAHLGAKLWEKVQGERLISVNGGRTTIGFRPLHFNRTRDEIDKIVLTCLHLREEFAAELRSHVKNTVLVDENDSSRNHLQTFFTEEQ